MNYIGIRGRFVSGVYPLFVPRGPLPAPAPRRRWQHLRFQHLFLWGARGRVRQAVVTQQVTCQSYVAGSVPSPFQCFLSLLGMLLATLGLLSFLGLL